MKEPESFSGKEIEKDSVNFSKLREKGLEYIQKRSGEIWTDYNLHDPGVTILEQLIYGLTDAGFRTSLDIEDLLTTEKEQIDWRKNAFFKPSKILSSHPVTLLDTRKLIMDNFEEVENVWITPSEKTGYEEAVNGHNQIEILPANRFLKTYKNKDERKDFEIKVTGFLQKNRNIGEYFQNVVVLQPQYVSLNFKIYLTDKVDFHATIANLYVKLVEFFYSPIQYSSIDELKQDGMSLEELFSGPRFTSGFIKEMGQSRRLKTIHISQIQKLVAKVDGISKCIVDGISVSNGVQDATQVTVEEKKFLHILREDYTNDFFDNRFDEIYKNMTVFMNNKELKDYNRQKINLLFSKTWSKKYRRMPTGGSPDKLISEKIQGTFQNPKEYYSIQNHFPVIYGIGKEGLSKHEPDDRKAKARQLKGFLMLFEQHIANHLAQLAQFNSFFNIGFNNDTQNTYYTQRMNSVPGIEELEDKDSPEIETYLESENSKFNRKNRIYDHLLARFGEELNEIPWKTARHLQLIRNDQEYNRAVLRQKSLFLIRLENLSYNRTKGEYFFRQTNKSGKIKYKRIASGLEEMLLIKTGIPHKKNNSLLHSFQNKYTGFENMEISSLFRETVKHGNYRINKEGSDSEKPGIEFQYKKNSWIKIGKTGSHEATAPDIYELVDFFVKLNQQCEGLYIVDHILLNDLLEDSRTGFKFMDYDENTGVTWDDDAEYGNFSGNDETRTPDFKEEDFVLFRTENDHSWGKNETERNENIKKFYRFGKIKDSYEFEGDDCVIRDTGKNIIASCKRRKLNQENSNDERDKIYHKTLDMIQLFTSSEKSNGRLRFTEMEKRRLLGVNNPKHKIYGQRRLVYQRKLWNNEIVDESFFDLKISVILPNWPVRFQSEQFKDYVTGLVRERLPAHVGSEIFWIDVQQMESFELKYTRWKELKSEPADGKKPAENLMKAAFEVYTEIQQIKKSKK